MSRATVALAAAALLAAGCTAPAPPPAAAEASPAPVEGATYAVRHAGWPAGQEVPVVYRGGMFRPL